MRLSYQEELTKTPLVCLGQKKAIHYNETWCAWIHFLMYQNYHFDSHSHFPPGQLPKHGKGFLSRFPSILCVLLGTEKGLKVHFINICSILSIEVHGNYFVNAVINSSVKWTCKLSSKSKDAEVGFQDCHELQLRRRRWRSEINAHMFEYITDIVPLIPLSIPQRIANNYIFNIWMNNTFLWTVYVTRGQRSVLFPVSQ